MEELYFVDRPTIPATSQVLVKIDSIFDNALTIDMSDIERDYFGYVVEVKDTEGDVAGTLVFFPGVPYADLIAPEILEEELEEGLEEPIEEPSTPDDGVASPPSDDLPEDSAGIEDAVDAIRQERLLNLELELSAAKQHVQDIEDEIADEEGALD